MTSADGRIGADTIANNVDLTRIRNCHLQKELPSWTCQQPVVARNPSDEVIRLGPLAVRFLATSAETNGSLALFELTVPAGAHLAAPPHSHDHYEETIYGLEGRAGVEGGRDVDRGPALARRSPIPRGAVHQPQSISARRTQDGDGGHNHRASVLAHCAGIRAASPRVDPDQPLYDVRPMPPALERTLRRPCG